MPEMKRNFTKGKMNKDLDERIVPNGEYRDAMNVQVSTSEHSDVGTVQNVLGNVPGCSVEFAPVNSYTVGSVSDEKNDTLYWLVSGQNTIEDSMSDMILRRRPSLPGEDGTYICEPVFVDNYSFTIPNNIVDPLNSDTVDIYAPGVLEQLAPGWTITGVNNDGTTSSALFISDVNTGNSFMFDWNFYTSNAFVYQDWCVGATLNPLAPCGATNTYIPMIIDLNGDFAINTAGGVYIANYSGSNPLVGGFIDIDPLSLGGNGFFGTGNNQYGYGITAENAASITVGGQGTLLTQLSLDSNLVLDPSLQGYGVTPSFVDDSGQGWLAVSYSSITQQLPNNTVVPDNGFITIPPPYDVSDYSIGDTITLNPNSIYQQDGCVVAIDTINNYLQLDDCSGNLLEPPILLPGMANPYMQDGDIVLEETISITLSPPSTPGLLNGYNNLYLQGPRVLNYNHDELILGINIIDDFLLWTDNKTEPKKISISRSVAGTDPTGNVHTNVIIPDASGSINPGINKGPAREEHITVIKKAPHRPPTLKIGTQLREGPTGEGYNIVMMGNYFDAIGEKLYVKIVDVGEAACDFVVGDFLGLAIPTGGLTFEDMDYEVKLKILEINEGPWTNVGGSPSVLAGETAYLVEVITLIDNVNTLGDNWEFELIDDQKFLFERKLPRFAYRYKYVDNEYSTYGPFSDVAFYPGGFEYQPVKAYNEGMTNRVRTLVLQDFVSSDIPEDVVQIDLLYKNENSPLVYLMDSIKQHDAGGLNNNWNSPGSNKDIIGGSKGSYKVTTENIYAALPANQTIRTWDNVPKTALAQDVSGNRVIYGNYTQGYTVEEVPNDPNGNLVPDITVALVNRPSLENDEIGQKSIKSLRDYDIGVVWGDKYGRETPVITPSSGSFNVAKRDAKENNYIRASLEKSPYWADYYRFYIKETSNQYYNLAVDRIYDAEDGNIWISFPSVDRNKVDEDTYIILKKGSDSDDLVEEKARYKIVAIANEAPEFIKTEYEELARTNTDSTRYTHSCQMWGGQINYGWSQNGNTGCPIYPIAQGFMSPPVVGRKQFSIDKNNWVNEWTAAAPGISPAMGLPDLKKLFEDINADNTSDEFYVSFTKETQDPTSLALNVITGSKYRVLEVKNGERDIGFTDPSTNLDGTYSSVAAYQIILSEPIKSSDEFVVAAYSDPNNPGYLQNDDIHVTFWKKTIRNKPEFDGRFFVKIYSDGNDRKNLSSEPASIKNWSITATTPLHKIWDSTDPSTAIPGHLNDLSLDTYNFASVSGGSTRTKSDWNALLKFGGVNPVSRWFIDAASFASKQPLNSSNYSNALAVHTDPNNNQVFSSDMTTSVNHDMYCFSCFWGAGLNLYLWGSFNGTGESTSLVGMKGAFTDSGQTKKLDIGFSKIGPTGNTGSGGRYEGYTVDWRVGDPSNTEHDDEVGVVQGLAVNRRFRLQGSPIIYRIKQVQKFRLFNYQGKKTATPVKRRLYNPLTFSVNTYWNTEHLSQVQLMAEQQNRRFTYRISYDVDLTATNESDLVAINPAFAPSGVPATTTLDIFSDPKWSDISNVVDYVNAGTPVTSVNLEFLEEFNVKGENKISTNPAIFETEPKEDADLDLYYEASSSFPAFPITNRNKEIYIPLGSTIEIPSNFDAVPWIGGVNPFELGTFVTGWDVVIPIPPPLPQLVTINISTTITQGNAAYVTPNLWPEITFLRDDGTYVAGKFFAFTNFYTDNDPSSPNFGSQISNSMVIIPVNSVGLSWHNCWSFGNGVESNRIGDTYNKPFLGNGVSVSSILQDNFKEEYKKYSLIYSGIYNSNSGTNSLNQFIAGEKITKDLNPIYGSIQRLKAGWGQGGDLIALCEDRILKILANKDALFNADGDTNVTSTNRVLGQAIPYSGEYGISKNPESFASEAYRAYFTDKVRGTVMRLSMDGLTPISDAGMKDWFKDNLKLNNKIVGSYDDKKDEYNVSLMVTTENVSKSVTYKESIKGWVSFKSFVTQNGISCANDYFTFKGGKLWLHNDEMVDRNTFYNVFTSSSFEVVLNDAPGVIKSFYTLNYEGSQTKVEQNTSDDQYFNTHAHHVTNGWYVDHIFTDKESGDIEKGFIEKEGKWFNYIKGSDVIHNPDDSVQVNIDGSSTWDGGSFAMQGLGSALAVDGAGVMLGCTDPTATNYDPTANTDDGSCILVSGCTEPTSVDYDPTAANEDGSCTWTGCTDPAASNTTNFGPAADAYNLLYPGAITDDGTCAMPVPGCTDVTADNYDPTATIDDGSCIYSVPGCMEPLAVNYNANATEDDPGDPCYFSLCQENGSDSNYLPGVGTAASNYINNVNASGYINNECFDGGCLDPSADNYVTDANGNPINPLGNVILWEDTSGPYVCTYPAVGGCMDTNYCEWNEDATFDDGSCGAYCDWNDCNGVAYPNPITLGYGAETNGNSNGSITVYPNAGALYQPLIISCPTCPSAGVDQGGGVIKFFGLSAGSYDIEVTSGLFNNSCMFTQTQSIGNVNFGCTDNTTPDGSGIGTFGANNYDANADIDDGSCTYTTNCWKCGPNGTALEITYDDIPDTNLANIVFANLFGQNACTESPGAQASGAEDFMTAVAYVLGPNPVWQAVNFDPVYGIALLDDQTMCTSGCMSSDAANYDGSAVFDDGSCVWIVYGDSPTQQGTDSCHVIDDPALAPFGGSEYFFPSGANNTLGDALCECCNAEPQDNIELADGTFYTSCCDYAPCGCSN